ncbi:MAG: ATP synthase subunit I [Aureliella sp.]
MTELLNAAPLLATGFSLGLMFFGGLWWTVNKGLTSKHPALWFLTSQLLRVGFTLIGFYFVADGQWQRLLLCLTGFLIARLLITQWTKRLEGCADFSRPLTSDLDSLPTRAHENAEEVRHAS